MPGHHAKTVGERGDARRRLLEAALASIRARGLHATTVDGLCAAADTSKGSFFHHFGSKEELAVAAAEYWTVNTGSMFATAAYHVEIDPLERILSYIDLRASLICGRVEEFTCLIGTMVQEAFLSTPAVRDACAADLLGHAATLERDLAEAVDVHRPAASVDPASLSLHMQAVVQGAFILAKATNDPEVAVASIHHLRRYIELLFQPIQGAPAPQAEGDRP